MRMEVTSIWKMDAMSCRWVMSNISLKISWALCIRLLGASASYWRKT